MAKDKTTKALEITALILALGLVVSGGFMVLRNNGGDGKKETIPITASAAPIIKNSPTTNNLTEELGARLAQEIINTGVDPQETDIKLVSPALEEVSKTITLPIISDAEIIISNDNSEEAIKEYFNLMVSSLKEYTPSEQEIRSEIEIINEAINANDFSDVYKYRESYQNALRDIKQIPVPSSWKDIHKQQIAIFSLIIDIYKSAETAKQDAATTAAYVSKYEEMPLLFNQLANDVFDLIEEQKSIFTES